MLEKVFEGSKKYWLWVAFLLLVIMTGIFAYAQQFTNGLGVTGMSRDVTWGIYISQFTFLVGVAASGVMVVIPYYLHNYKKFGKTVILGEFLAVPALIMAMLFIVADMGQPLRVFNVILHPTPHSMMFWDMCVLLGYLMINLIVGWCAISSEYKQLPPPRWVKPLIYLSIPFAISIHTVTAFLYAGLPGRHMWLTAITAARFLASAFAGGPAILILLIFIVRKISKFDPGDDAIKTLSKIVTYAMIANVFFYVLELFTAFYSNIPDHKASLTYLFAGLNGYGKLVPFMWTAVVLSFIGIALLLIPKTRNNFKILPFSLLAVVIACWIDKGLGFILGGFVPTPLEHVTEYFVTGIEAMVTIGIYAIGVLFITLLYKIVIAVREQV